MPFPKAFKAVVLAGVAAAMFAIAGCSPGNRVWRFGGGVSAAAIPGEVKS